MENDSELRSFSDFAFDFDASVASFGDDLYDGESKPRSFVFAGEGIFQLDELFKNRFVVLLPYPDSRIAHVGEAGSVFPGSHAATHRASRLGELHGVRNEIMERSADFFPIRGGLESDEIVFEAHRDLLPFADGREIADDFGYYCGKIEFFLFEFFGAAFDSRKFEHVSNEFGHVRRLFGDFFRTFLCGERIPRRERVFHHRRVSPYDGKGGAEFVASDADELAFFPIEFGAYFERFAKPLVGDFEIGDVGSERNVLPNRSFGVDNGNDHGLYPVFAAVLFLIFD